MNILYNPTKSKQHPKKMHRHAADKRLKRQDSLGSMVRNRCRDASGIVYWFPKPLRLLLIVVMLIAIMIALMPNDQIKIIKREKVSYIYSLMEFSSNIFSHQESFTMGMEEVAKAVVFICIDSSFLSGSGNMVTIMKNWYTKETFIQECQQNSYCSIHLMFYAEDTNTTTNVREEIKAIFNTGNMTNKNQTISHEIAKSPGDARTISDIMVNLYAEGFDYFLLVTTPQMEYEGRITLSLKELTSKLSSQNPKNVGVLRFNTPMVNKFNTKLAGFLFSKVHIEIFGAAFPYLGVPSLTVAMDFISRIYPRALALTLSLKSTEIVPSKAFTSNSTLMTGAFLSEQAETLTRYLKAVEDAHGCLRCSIKNSKKIIAMSLYGTNPRYTLGALRNAQLFPVIFPGWRLWFYTEKEPPTGVPRKTHPITPAIVSRIEELQAEFRYIDTNATGLAPMLWRFSAAEDPEVEYLSVRDCDSRLTPRDVVVVEEWIKSGKAFHCIRDHPSHSNYAISGGLWGSRPAQLKQIFNNSLLTLMKGFGAGYIADMNFLGAHVWPKVKDNHTFCHDSFSCTRYASSHPFPVARKEFEHLGQVFDYHHVGRGGDIAILQAHAVNKKCVP